MPHPLRTSKGAGLESTLIDTCPGAARGRMESERCRIALLVANCTFAIALMFAPGIVKTRPVKTRPQTDDLAARARNLHFSSLVVDTHADTPQRLIDGDFDLATHDPKGSVDIPRMKEGGLDAIFFSIWVPSKVTGPIAVKRASEQIQAVRDQVRKHPNDLALATTAAEVREIRKQK